LSERQEVLSEKLGAALVRRDLTVALAESCTGGMVMKYLSDVPGSSRYLLGGVVSYSDALKINLLGVPGEIIREYGAVSEPTARLMAAGVRKITGAALGLGVTGIAGPGGATETKPVGLVYIAVAGAESVLCREFIFSGRRAEVRADAAYAALDMIWQYAITFA